MDILAETTIDMEDVTDQRRIVLPELDADASFLCFMYSDVPYLSIRDIVKYIYPEVKVQQIGMIIAIHNIPTECLFLKRTPTFEMPLVPVNLASSTILNMATNTSKEETKKNKDAYERAEKLSRYIENAIIYAYGPAFGYDVIKETEVVILDRKDMSSKVLTEKEEAKKAVKRKVSLGSELPDWAKNASVSDKISFDKSSCDEELTCESEKIETEVRVISYPGSRRVQVLIDKKNNEVVSVEVDSFVVASISLDEQTDEFSTTKECLKVSTFEHEGKMYFPVHEVPYALSKQELRKLGVLSGKHRGRVGLQVKNIYRKCAVDNPSILYTCEAYEGRKINTGTSKRKKSSAVDSESESKEYDRGVYPFTRITGVVIDKTEARMLNCAETLKGINSQMDYILIVKDMLETVDVSNITQLKDCVKFIGNVGNILTETSSKLNRVVSSLG